MNRCLVWVFSNHPVFVLVSFVVFHNFPLLEYHVLLVKHNLLRGIFPVQADLPSSRLADTAFLATAPAHLVAVSHSGNFTVFEASSSLLYLNCHDIMIKLEHMRSSWMSQDGGFLRWNLLLVKTL